MSTSDFNQIKKIVEESLDKRFYTFEQRIEARMGQMEDKIGHIKDKMTTLATKEELDQLREDAKETVRFLIDKMDRFGDRLELVENKLDYITFRFDDVKDILISNQVSLQDHAKMLKKLESKVFLS